MLEGSTTLILIVLLVFTGAACFSPYPCLLLRLWVPLHVKCNLYYGHSLFLGNIPLFAVIPVADLSNHEYTVNPYCYKCLVTSSYLKSRECTEILSKGACFCYKLKKTCYNSFSDLHNEVFMKENKKFSVENVYYLYEA